MTATQDWGPGVYNERGVTFLFLMFVIVLIGLSVTGAARQWKTLVQRELEADLLAKGVEIQNAIALYSATQKAGRVVPGERYPRTLEELTKLPRPFLRKAYKDPITRGDWEYLRGPDGGIAGVRSKSRATPIKQRNFPAEVRHFEGLPRYQDWMFMHPSPSATQALPGAISGSGGVPAPGPGNELSGGAGLPLAFDE